MQSINTYCVRCSFNAVFREHLLYPYFVIRTRSRLSVQRYCIADNNAYSLEKNLRSWVREISGDVKERERERERGREGERKRDLALLPGSRVTSACQVHQCACNIHPHTRAATMMTTLLKSGEIIAHRSRALYAGANLIIRLCLRNLYWRRTYARHSL